MLQIRVLASHVLPEHTWNILTRMEIRVHKKVELQLLRLESVPTLTVIALRYAFQMKPRLQRIVQLIT